MLKFVEREQLCFNQMLMLNFKKTTISYAWWGCYSREFQNSKTKKAKTNFPMDKSKVAKTKYKDVNQKEVTIDKGHATQVFFCKG